MNEKKVRELIKDKEYVSKAISDFSNDICFREISISINDAPESYSRERSGRGNHFYNPKGKKMVEFRSKALHAMRKDDYRFMKKLMKRDYREYSIRLYLDFYLPIQKGSSNKDAVLKELGVMTPTSRPDNDNYVKFAMDALHDVLYSDDAAVTSIITQKRYSLDPRTDIMAIIEYHGDPIDSDED